MDSSKTNSKCEHDNCGLIFKNINLLRNHLIDIHGESHPCHEFYFRDKDLFDKWQAGYEEKHLVKYRVYDTKFSRRNKHDKTINKRCNRSSCYLKPSVSTGQRAAKAKLQDGPTQSSSACTATLHVTVKDGSYYVKAYPTHANHPVDNIHKKTLGWPEAEKENIINQLENDVSIPVILSKVYKEVKEEYQENKGELATHQVKANYDTIYNMKKHISNAKIQSNQDDLPKILQMKSTHDTDIIYLKKQEVGDAKYKVIIYQLFLEI